MRMIFYWIFFLSMYIICSTAGQSPSSIKDGKTCSFHEEKKCRTGGGKKPRKTRRTNTLYQTRPGQAEGNSKKRNPHTSARLPPCIEERPSETHQTLREPEGRDGWMWSEKIPMGDDNDVGSGEVCVRGFHDRGQRSLAQL